jgi:hypothetical protein
MLDTILAKLKEPGTISGIILLLGVVGVHISPELANNIITLTGATIGIVEIAKKG